MNKILKNKYILLALILSVILIGVGASYALFSEVLVGERNYVINVGNLQVLLDESATLENIIQNGSIPISDVEGRKLSGYNFSLVNNEISDLSYTIYIVEDTKEKKTPSNDIKLYYTRDYGNVYELKYLSDTNNNEKKVLETGVIPKGKTFNYNLKLWIASTAGNEILGTSYSCHIEVEATQIINELYVDNSGANIPEISTGMIPVTYDGTNWVKADVSKKWYDYDEQWWANAVTVSESNRDTYMNAEAGTPISMDDINTMWVWIPRYEYETITSTTATEIKVNFLNGTERNWTTNYITHPAFTFGTDELTGIWVAKFEASSDVACTAANYSVDTGCDVTTLKVNVKPNVTSWRGIRSSTADLNSRSMNASGNIYGFIESEVDTHVMKNMEWGAVAYLTQSKYGRCVDGTCTEVTINSNSSYTTGYSNVTYSENNGVLASTSGNIYGVYDMSGGSWEYVMGVIKDNTTDGNPMSGNSDAYNSGFEGYIYNSNNYKLISGRVWPESKYFDLYEFGTTYNDAAAYARSKTGDATTETKGWYEDYAIFASSEFPWFIRGGYYSDSTNAGVFYFSRSSGYAHVYHSFRPVLVQK